MKPLIARLATVVATVPLAMGMVAGTAQANHSVTVPGCFGAATAVACDLTVTIGVPAGVTTYQDTVAVCAGSCYDVPVTLVTTQPGEPTSVCYHYYTRAGSRVDGCADAGGVIRTVTEQVDPLVAYAEYLVSEVIPYVQNLKDEVLYTIRELLRGGACGVINRTAYDLGLYVECAS